MQASNYLTIENEKPQYINEMISVEPVERTL